MNDKYNDIVGDLLRGITWAEKANLQLISMKKNDDKQPYEVLPRYRCGPFKINNPIATKFIQFMYENVRSLDKDIDDKEYVDKE